MAENSKLKVLYILDIMKKTDENHPLNTSEIGTKLQEYGIVAERKSIARDLQCLEDAGYTIVKCENHNDGWYMSDQDFEDYELKMLVDAIASAKFLTIEDSRKIIKKLKKLATKDGERLIDSTMVLDDQMKLLDKKFKFKFDTIMRAIADNKQITFQYQDRDSGSKKKLRYDGYYYKVSPYYIILHNDEYYAVTNLKNNNSINTFRIELMENVSQLDEPCRPTNEIVDLKDIGGRKHIGDLLRESVHLWNGTPETVTLEGYNSVRIHLQKNYGQNISIRDEGEDKFVARVNLVLNEGFYQWLAGYSDNIKITSPQKAVDGFKEYLKRTLAQYE